MTDGPIHEGGASGEAGALASMFEAGASGGSAWQDGDLAAVLRHQMAAPLRADLATLPGVVPEQVERLAGAADPPVHCFRDLLGHPAPPVGLLELTKRFAKRARRRPGTALPDGVAAVLYFGSILAARDRAGASISDLSAAQLEDGRRWLWSQPWLDPATRALFDPAAHSST